MRLFFALTCPSEVALQIDLWRSTLGLHGQPVSAGNLHVTLAFPGEQPDSKLSRLVQLAESIEAEPFTLQLDQLESCDSGLVYLVPSKPPRALLDLASQLHQALGHAGIVLEQRVFRPHLTLSRCCRQSIGVTAPVFSWNVEQFGLYLSQAEPGGSRYQALASRNLLLPG